MAPTGCGKIEGAIEFDFRRSMSKRETPQELLTFEGQRRKNTRDDLSRVRDRALLASQGLQVGGMH